MKPVYQAATLAFVAALLLLAFNNCSNVAFSPVEESSTAQGEPGIPEVPPVLTVAQKCQNATLLSQTVMVDFPAPVQKCAFGVGGNLGTKDSYFQARTEQEVEFQLPVGATICDLDFKFQKQQFYYDDHIALALNDRILATSYNWVGLLSKDANGLEVYDWSKIVGQDWQTPSNKEGVFCAGKIEGKATCNWPQTQEEGDITMDFDKTIIQKVMEASTTVDKHIFKFITTGDNDVSLDCWHKDISFAVEVKYVK